MIIKPRVSHHLIVIYLVLGLVPCLSLIPVDSMAQEKSARKLANQYFQSHQYREAADLLAIHLKDHPKDLEAHFQLANSLYRINKLDEAIIQLNQLLDKGKRFSEEATLLLARSHHHKHLFRDAIKYYKKYLSISEVRDDRRQEVINNIKRCAEGVKQSYPSDQVFIENMGSTVNSPHDEFAPIASPNVDSRVYFTSNRKMKIADHFSDDGTLIESRQKRDYDMFGTEISNGAWSDVFPLNDELDSDQHEILQDFNTDGSVVYFTRGVAGEDQVFYLDSFNSLQQPPEGIPWAQLDREQREQQVRGFHFFADSILIFSAKRTNGHGGYDLYICTRGSDGWQDAVNLGSKINGPFDEVTPFMALDGRTLYFSSNGLTSVGGHDVFKSRFDEKVNGWSTPKNLSLPVNSAADDVHFRLARNGLTAHFSSDRKTGKGGQDLYAIYFSRPRQEQLVRSTPPIFYMVKDFQLFSESLVGSDKQPAPVEMLESEWDLSSILYREDDRVLTPQNKAKLDNLISFLKTYPHLKLEIMSHSDQESVSNFDLFFSIKRAEDVAKYLISNGINADIILVKGYGGSYPYAYNSINGKDNRAGRFYNRRLDFNLLGTDKLPVKIHQRFPEVAKSQMTSELPRFYQQRKGLFYRIEFAYIDQLYKGNLIGKYPDPSIEKSMVETNYHYTSGIFSSFALALDHLAEIKGEGFDNAIIVPFVMGERLNSDEISEDLIAEYPDLKEFELYLK